MKRRHNVVLFVACCVLALVSVQLAQAQDGQLTWTQNLNNGGRVYAMVIDPTNQSTIYSAGLDSGVYKTTNAGVSWFAVNTGLTYNHVQALAISPSNPNVLYAGTDHLGGANKGVYVTTNGGTSWTLTSTSMADSGIQGLAVHPTNPNTAYAAVFDGVVPNPTNGLYKTTDGGVSWFADTAGIGLNRRFLCVAINPFNGNTVYAGTSFLTTPATPEKIYKSVNGGNTWTEITNGLPQLSTNVDPVRAFSISTVDTSTVLAALFVNDTAGGAFLTTNGGALWVKMHNGIPNVAGVLLRSCLIRPGSTREFYVGLDARGVYRTVDGGNNWVDFSGGALANTFTIRGLVFRTLRDSTLYAGAATTSPTTARGVFEYSWPTHDLGVSALQRITTFDYPGGGNPLAMDGPSGGDQNAITLAVDGPFALADTVRFRAIVRDYGSIPESTYQVRWSVDGVVQATLNNTRPVVVAGTDTFLFQWNAGTPGAHTARAWTLLATDADRSNDTASNAFTITPPASGCDTLRNLGTIPAYPTASFGHASAALGDTLYIAGGSATGVASTTFVTYCISTATWGTGSPMPEAKTGGDLIAAGGSLYYIGGGSGITVATATCYKYTPAAGWSAIASIPTAVTGNVAESWGDSVIFCVAGGWTTYLTTVQVYRPTSNTWSTSTPLPAGRGRRSFAGGLWGNKFFVNCGFSGVFRKDFLIGTIIRADSIVWAVGPDVPMRTGAVGSSRPGGHAVDGRFYLITGETTPAPTPQDSIYIWDIAAGQWSTTIIQGRGTTSASNYWGVISSSIIGGNVKIWIPGGALGTAVTPLWVIDACATIPPPTPGWTVRTSTTTSFLQSVKQVNATVIWAAGNGATVRRSTDGGTTWTNGNPNPGVITGDIYNIDALDANTAFVTTSPAATFIYRTTNGGTLWTQVYTLAGGFINAIRMNSATNGIATGDPVGTTFTILRTTDGGATWNRLTTEPIPNPATETGLNNSLSTVGTTHIWFGSSVGPVWRSTDAGVTWTRVATTFTGNNLEVHFNNTTNGVTGNSAGLANRSTDGGATWVATTIPGAGGVNGLSGAGFEFFASKGTNVYRSTDKGATWTVSYTGAIGTLAHLDFFTPNPAVPNSFYGTAVSQTGGIATAFLALVTGVDEDATEIPKVFSLMQNYPNPFNPSTTLRYALSKDARVTLSIYNILGQRIATLKDEVQSVGYYNVLWDGRNDFGSQIASGVYFYRIEAKPVDGSEPFMSIKKMLMLK